MSDHGLHDSEKKGSGGSAIRKIVAFSFFGIAFVGVVLAIAFVQTRDGRTLDHQDADRISAKTEVISKILKLSSIFHLTFESKFDIWRSRKERAGSFFFR